ncbi:MAG: GNAT family N-acetyltransferase [Acetobacteraceae bacterium]|nr:GNAT family N-acetyltransferase [Acetobacteraceae bacterium]
MTPRRATAEDRHALAMLLAELAREHGQDSDPLAAADTLLAGKGKAGPVVLVAPEGAALLGFAALVGHFPARGFTWGLTLTDLFVSASHRSKGVGRALLRAACAFAREEGYTRVENAVREDEPLPRHFYAALGIAPAPRHVYRLEGALLDRLATEAAA